MVIRVNMTYCWARRKLSSMLSLYSASLMVISINMLNNIYLYSVSLMVISINMLSNR